ncbi:MAG: hypothetical protein QM767_28900 [Anaeromyxobacter sp.]
MRLDAAAHRLAHVAVPQESRRLRGEDMTNRAAHTALCVGLLFGLCVPHSTIAAPLCGYNYDPPEECYAWTCDTVTREWLQRPLSSGTACSENGKCDGRGQCVVAKGTLYPKYFIQSVVYAPPGSGSRVMYAASTKIGSTTSTSSSWGSSLTVEASVGADDRILSQSATYTVGNDWSTRSEVSVSKSTKAGFVVPGVSSDDIDHAYESNHDTS